MFVPITSIFQHDARCYEECNRGRPSPRAASKLDHHQQRRGANGSAYTCCSLSHVGSHPEGASGPSLTTPLANGAWTNTQMLHNQNSATPHKTLLLFLTINTTLNHNTQGL